MSYIDPKTKIQYPDKEWMFAHIDTLPEVRKAYPNYKAQKELPAGDLEHTLPPEEAEPVIGGLGLPADGKVDKLTLLGLALKNISRKALEKRKASATMGMIGTAGAAMGKFEKMGFDPSRMPGGFSGRIISMARQKAAEQLAKGKGEITQQFDTLETILGSIKESTEREQDLARQNLGILMQTRSLSTLGDKELENLSNVAGVPLEQLTAIKNAESADKTMLNAYKEMVETGKLKIESIPAEFRSDVVKILDVGKIPEGEEEVLSPTEAATLGVPYGTTKKEAVTMGITPAKWKGTEAEAESIVEEIDWNEATITALKEQGINDDEILVAAKEDGKEEEVRKMLEKEYGEGVMDTKGIVGGMSDTAYSLWKKAKSWLK